MTNEEHEDLLEWNRDKIDERPEYDFENIFEDARTTLVCGKTIRNLVKLLL